MDAVARLRLDTKEGAFRTRRGRTVIVPGKIAESELIKRITSGDETEVMPPPMSDQQEIDQSSIIAPPCF